MADRRSLTASYVYLFSLRLRADSTSFLPYIHQCTPASQYRFSSLYLAGRNLLSTNIKNSEIFARQLPTFRENLLSPSWTYFISWKCRQQVPPKRLYPVLSVTVRNGTAYQHPHWPNALHEYYICRTRTNTISYVIFSDSVTTTSTTTIPAKPFIYF
jgi:hypothetical protein